MWVIYEKKDRKIVGMTADSDRDLDKKVALEEVVRGLVNSGPVSRYGALQITDRALASILFSVPRSSVALREGAKGALEITIEETSRSFITLSSDAPDVHPVDGIPEIPADGESFTTISVQKVDELGQLLHGQNDSDKLYLRTDHGTLFSADGKEEISFLKLKKGQATFRLVSEKARRVATVQVFNADDGVLDSTIRIEFI
jgi:hypothetical protein